MECTIDETGVSQCLCPECQYNWQTFLRWTSRPATSPAPVACLTDPECECDQCVAGRERTAGQSLETLLGDNTALREISNSAGCSGLIVGFELVNGSVWCFEYPLGGYNDEPALVVPATPAGLNTILARFGYYL